MSGEAIRRTDSPMLPLGPVSLEASAPTAKGEMRTNSERLVADIMSQTMSVEVNSIARDEAINIASDITTKLRTLGSDAHRLMTPEDFELLAQMMSKLLEKGRN